MPLQRLCVISSKRTTDMIVLTLAAGLGSRLVPSLDEPIPKALISVGSENLLERQARQLSKSNTGKHIAVIGKQGDCWTEDYVQQFETTVDETVVNCRNAETEAGYSFLLGLDSVPDGEELLVIDGDIIVGDELLKGFQEKEAENVALVKAVETKVGLDRGACVSFGSDAGCIDRCGFDVRSNYVYSGAMKLSPSCVQSLAKLDPKEYEQEQLATLIDKIAQESQLTAYTVNPQVGTIPTVSKPLDDYGGTGETILEKHKGRITKRAKSGSKKLRDEIDKLRYGHSRHPENFPEIIDIALFDDEPSYQMPDYAERGYQSLADLLYSEKSPDKLEKLAEDPIRFIVKQFGNETKPIPGLYKNTFLPKIRTRYRLQEATARFESIAEAERLIINGKQVPGVPKVKKTLESDTEFLGRLEPRFMTDFHGDFKPDNILVDEDNGDFILIDPRGRSEIGTMTHDPTYDIAKFLTSTKGYYTALKQGEFEVLVDMKPSVSVDYEIKGCDRVFERLTEVALSHAEAVVGDETDWEVRIEALTGLLLIANAPVHVDGNRDRMAIVELVRGLELFEQARSKFTSRSEWTGNVININTESDLGIARKIFVDTHTQ